MRASEEVFLIKMQLKMIMLTVLEKETLYFSSSTEWLRVTLLTRRASRVATAATTTATSELVVVTTVVLVAAAPATAASVVLLWWWSCTASHHIVWIIHVRSSVRIVAIRLHALHLRIDLHGRWTASVHLAAEAAATSATAAAVVVAAAVGRWSAVL